MNKNTNTIDMATKDDLIETIMRDQKRTIGVEFRHENQIDITIKYLEKEGKIDPTIKKVEKEGIAMKMMIENYVLHEVKIPKEEWEDMKIDKFHSCVKTDKSSMKSQIVYCRFVDPRDATAIRTSLADKPKHISNKLVQYVHPSAYNRWKIYDSIAYQYRLKGNNTKIWHGRSDFLLLVKSKSDKSKWSTQAPRIVSENLLVDFDIGKLSDDDEEYYNQLKRNVLRRI